MHSHARRSTAPLGSISEASPSAVDDLQSRYGNAHLLGLLGPSRASASDPLARAAASPGRGLPADLVEQFSAAFGEPMGDVRIHTGPESDEAAASVGAEAWTFGRDVHFASGAFDPGSEGGAALLAHELAHAVQQGPVSGAPGEEATASGDAVEREADRAATAALDGGAPALGSAPPAVAREESADPSCEEATEQEQETARERILEAQRIALEAVRKNALWTVGQLTKYIADTAEAPGVVFRPELLPFVAAELVGRGTGAATEAAAVLGGAPGWILSKGLSALGAFVGDAVGPASPMGPEEASDAGREAVKQQLVAQISVISAQADIAASQMAPAYQAAMSALAPKHMDRQKVLGIRQWAEADAAASASRVASGDGLYLGLLATWVGKNMKNYRAHDPNVNDTSWKNAIEALYGGNQIPPGQYWAVQLRAEWVEMGLPTAIADALVASGAEPRSERPFGPMTGTATFTRATDTEALCSALDRPTGTPDGDHIRAGRPFSLTCRYTARAVEDQPFLSDPVLVLYLQDTHYTLDTGEGDGASVIGPDGNHGHGLW